MTPKQADLIEQLKHEMSMTDDDINEIFENLTGVDSSNWEDATVSDATILIDELIRMKRKGDHK